MFQKATKTKAKARVALIGPPGSGKTWTALVIAKELGAKIALIDTENASASKYADKFKFDTAVLKTFTPQSYIDTIHAGEAAYDVLIIDSLSHAWAGKDGVLKLVDDATARSKSKNAFTTGWREVTPQHNALVDAIVQCDCHLIVTMRVKTDYVLDTADGKSTPRKVGLAPIQREGLEYEFDIVGDIDIDHQLIITKSRCFELADKVIRKPDHTLGKSIASWLSEGIDAPTPEEVFQAELALLKKEIATTTDSENLLPLYNHQTKKMQSAILETMKSRKAELLKATVKSPDPLYARAE
jgi:hypothetical protein